MMHNVGFTLELVRRDFIERYAGSVLGCIWAVIWPFVDLFIYIIIFSKIMGGRLPGSSSMVAYATYLSVGLVPWKCFAISIGRSTSIFVDRKDIISKVNVSLLSLLIYINLAEIVTCIISFGFIAVFFWFVDYQLTWKILIFPLIFYLQQSFAFGLGLIFAITNVFIRDMKEVVGVVIQFWFWFTPIVYVIEIIPEIVKKLMIWNPGFLLIDSYHRIFVYDQYPRIHHILILAVLVHILIFVGLWVFRRLEKDIRDFI